jgi:hypothetical protein
MEMKQLIRTKGLVAGTPRAVVISALIHGAFLAAAGGLIVFTVVQKNETKFVPAAPVNRSKMKLKKLRVKMKQNIKPRQTPLRITSIAKRGMSDIQLPEISGIGGNLVGRIGGFEMMPDVSQMSLLGNKDAIFAGNEFEGTFYSLSLDRTGRRNSVTMGTYAGIMKDFFDSGWDPKLLWDYYRWPQKLYTSFIYLPTIGFEHVPRSFGIPDTVNTAQWMVHYKGKIMSHEDGRFRFWGRGNHVLAVKVDGKEVGYLGLPVVRNVYTRWRSSAEENRKYFTGKLSMEVGDWFELKAGQPVEIEIVIGDYNGADTQATLRIQKDGESYPTNKDGGPVLPVFKTAEIPEHIKDEIRYLTIEGDQDLDSDLIFNVY